MEALLGTTPDDTKLRVFGCRAYVQIHNPGRRNKFQVRADRALHMGLENGLHRLYIPDERKVVMTDHVSFDEHEFPSRVKTIEVTHFENDESVECQHETAEEEKSAASFAKEEDTPGIQDVSEKCQQDAPGEEKTNGQVRRSTRVRKQPN